MNEVGPDANANRPRKTTTNYLIYDPYTLLYRKCAKLKSKRDTNRSATHLMVLVALEVHAS